MSWEAASGWTAIVALGLAVLWRRQDRQRKHIDWWLRLDLPVNDDRVRESVNFDAAAVVGTEAVAKRTVTYATPRVVTLVVRNSGRQVIDAADFSSPVTFSFGRWAKIVDANILHDWPAGSLCHVPIVIADGGRTATMTPDFMNPGDCAVIRFVVDNEAECEVLARIKGETREVRKRRLGPPNPPEKLILLGMGYAMVFVLFVFGSLIYFMQSPDTFDPESAPLKWVSKGMVLLMWTAVPAFWFAPHHRLFARYYRSGL